MGLMDSLRSLFGGGKKQAAPARQPSPQAPAAAAATVSATAAVATAAGSTSDPVREAALGLVGPGGSGLPALLEKLKDGGLREVIDTWVGTGDNMPVSAGGLSRALGPETIAGIAGKLGLPEDEVAAGLASALPEVVDKLTPEGFVPDADGLAKHFAAQFKK